MFYIDWRDVQWYYFLPNCGYGITFNLGHASSTGFDLDLNARVTDHLLGSLSVGYTDAKFLKTVIQGTQPTPVVFNGQTLGQAPWTVYASLEYQFDVGVRPGFYARLIDDFKSANNGPFLYQFPDSAVAGPDLRPGPSRNQLDLRIGRVWKGIDLSLFVSNVLDAHPAIVNPQATHYVGYDFNSGDPVSSPIFSYSTITPRTFGITGIYNF